MEKTLVRQLRPKQKTTFCARFGTFVGGGGGGGEGAHIPSPVMADVDHVGIVETCPLKCYNL